MSCGQPQGGTKSGEAECNLNLSATPRKQLEEMLKVEEKETIERITGVSQTKIESQAEVQKAEKIHQYSRKDSGLDRFWTSREGKKRPRHFADWVFSVKSQGLTQGYSLSAAKPFSEFCSLNGEKY